jgi:hypothetical protein
MWPGWNQHLRRLVYIIDHNYDFFFFLVALGFELRASLSSLAQNAWVTPLAQCFWLLCQHCI